MAAMEHGAKLPVLNMPDVLRDPVAALAGREVPVTLLQQRATSFLQRCHVCLAPESARHARGTRPADSQPTLLFHASDRQPPCGAAITRGHVYWASRSAALYAQRHACERRLCPRLHVRLAHAPLCAQTSTHSSTRRARSPSLCRRRQSVQRCPCTSRLRSSLRNSQSRRSCWRSPWRGRGSSSCIWTMMRASCRRCLCRRCQPSSGGCRRTCAPGRVSASTSWRRPGAWTAQQR